MEKKLTHAEKKNVIHQAAEDYRKDSKYVQGIGSIENLKKIQDMQYARVVNHFLDYCKNQEDAEVSHFANVLSTKLNQ